MPLSGVSRAYRVYQKALDAYARERSSENFFTFESAYRALVDSPTSLRGERLAAESEFKRRLNERRSLDLFIADEALRVQSAAEAQRQALEETLAQERERVAQLQAERDRVQGELVALKAQLESLQKASPAPEREAQYEQLRTSIRSLMDISDFSAAAAPALIQRRMDSLFEVYALADRFAQLTQNSADRGLRKKIAIAVRNLFNFYQGADGKRGDAAIRNRYRARINELLTKEQLATIPEVLPAIPAPGGDGVLPTPEDIALLD